MKLLIADDHPMVRDALVRTVQTLEPTAEILQAQDYAEVVTHLAARPDLLLLDLHMPGMGGVDGVLRLRAACPALRIVVASGEANPALSRRVLAAGVAGFLPKSEPTPVLMQALRLVLAGGNYTPSQTFADYRSGLAPRPVVASALTVRQLDVLRLLMQGQPNKLIARALGLTEGTVKIHIAAILRALQARNRTEAVVMARRLGIEA